MANTDAAFGLRPVRHLDGSDWNGALNEYSIASGYGTNLFIGDPLVMVSDGTVARAAAGDTDIVGVFMGCAYTSSNDGGVNSLDRKYWPASTVASDAVAFVCDAPDVIFHVQADDDSAAIAATDVGANADILVTAGSTTTYTSGVELDASSITASTAQLRILRLAKLPNNEWGDFAVVEVLINEHAYKQTAGT